MSIKKNQRPIDKQIAKRVLARSRGLNFSQEHVAYKLGISSQEFRAYTEGLKSIPPEHLFDLSAILDVRLSFFYC